MRRREMMLAGLAAAVPISGRPNARPIVLELFTSQGCSSCPPADALLGVLERQPGIIALAWHVDYWNGLGWHDPFATRLATERQRAYAIRLHTEVYTPALVVNGGAAVVGSDRDAIAAAVRQAQPARIAISFHADPFGLSAGFEPVTRATALLALYDPVREASVGSGENGGRVLREYNVVRSVIMAPQQAVAAGKVRFPVRPAGRGAVFLLQDATLRIIGAAALPA